MWEEMRESDVNSKAVQLELQLRRCGLYELSLFFGLRSFHHKFADEVVGRLGVKDFAVILVDFRCEGALLEFLGFFGRGLLGAEFLLGLVVFIKSVGTLEAIGSGSLALGVLDGLVADLGLLVTFKGTAKVKLRRIWSSRCFLGPAVSLRNCSTESFERC